MLHNKSLFIRLYATLGQNSIIKRSTSGQLFYLDLTELDKLKCHHLTCTLVSFSQQFSFVCLFVRSFVLLLLLAFAELVCGETGRQDCPVEANMFRIVSSSSVTSVSCCNMLLEFRSAHARVESTCVYLVRTAQLTVPGLFRERHNLTLAYHHYYIIQSAG